MTAKKKATELALRHERGFEAALRHPELGDRERVLYQAYVHFEAEHGGACGLPGVCWPSDAELAAYLGRSDVTTRRARRRLSNPALGLVRVSYVKPFGVLPNGEKCWHGANVVTLLELRAVPSVADGQLELLGAHVEVARLERELKKARASVEAISGALAAARKASSRNAPSKTAPEGSLLLGPWAERGGERRRPFLAKARATVASVQLALVH